MPANFNIFINVLSSFIKAKKIYFIVIFCVLNIAGFFYFENNKPTSLAGMMNEADNFTKNGQIAYAIENYNKIVRLFPKNYEAHIHLAELYLKVNEIDMAKVEYIKAMNLGYKNKYQGNISIANIYAKEKNYALAESFVTQIKDINNKKAQQLIGDFYYRWGEYIKKSNKAESIRKYKIAYKYYKKSNSPNLLKLKKEVINTYVSMSNELLEIKKQKDAIDILKLSLNFWDNAESHYRLAKIYEKYGRIDNALIEYKTAFNLNPKIASKDAYAALLIKKALMLQEKGDKVAAELYYTRAKKVDSKANVPINPDGSIIIYDLETKCNGNIDKDMFIPQISFKLTNISKDKINYLKIKIVFMENENIFSEEIQTIATEKNPLKEDSTTDQINIFSSEPVNYVFDEHNLLAQVYISQKEPDNWVLFRNVKILWELNSGIITRNK